MGNIAELSEIRLQMASMHQVMGRSATFVNTLLIGSRPNRANTTCSHENMWREEENKKSILHTFPDDKSGVKRGENVLDRTWEWHKTESESEQNRRQTQSVKYGRCPRGEWGRVQNLHCLFSCRAALRLNYISTKTSTNLLRQVPSSLGPERNDSAEEMKSASLLTNF